MMYGMSPDMAAMGHRSGGSGGVSSGGINVNMSKSVLFRNAQAYQNLKAKNGVSAGSNKMTATGTHRPKIRYGVYYSGYFDACEEDEEGEADDYLLNEDGTEDDLFYQRRKQRQIGRFRVQQEKEKQKQQQKASQLAEKVAREQQKRDSTGTGENEAFCGNVGNERGSGCGILPRGKKLFVRIARLISIKNMLCRNGNGKQSSTGTETSMKCSLSRGNGGKRPSIPVSIIANFAPMPTIIEENDAELDLTIHRLTQFPTPGSVESIQDSAISSGSGSEGEPDPNSTTMNPMHLQLPEEEEEEGLEKGDEEDQENAIWDRRRQRQLHHEQEGREYQQRNDHHRVFFRAATAASNGADFYSKWAHAH